MGSTVKNNSVQAFWVAVGSFSSFALSIVSTAILSRYFIKSEYGTYRQVIYVYNTLLIVFSAGLPSVFAYYLPKHTLGQGREVVFKISRVLFFLGLIFSVFLFCFSGIIAVLLKNPELSRGLKYFSPVPMLMLPTLGIEGIFSTYKKTIFIAVYNVISRLLTLLFIVVPVILFKGGYLSAIEGWLLASFLTLVLALFFKIIPFRGITKETSGLRVSEILKYSVPIAVASIAGIAIKAADQFYISRFFGPEIFADFSNGFIELPFVGMITGAAATILMPLFSKIVSDKTDSGQIISLWQSSLRKSTIIIYPIVLFFIFFSKETMSVLYSSLYTSSAKYFVTILVLNFFNVIVFAPLLLSLGETKFYAYVHVVLAAVAWILEYMAVIIFNNPMAVAILSVTLSIIKILVFLRFSSRKIGISFGCLFPVGRLSIIFLHSLVCVLIISLFKIVLSSTGNLLIIVISGIGYLILLYFSSRIFSIDYHGLVKPLFVRNK
jgi:O-antigen/teichoic acid export membrane protein